MVFFFDLLVKLHHHLHCSWLYENQLLTYLNKFLRHSRRFFTYQKINMHQLFNLASNHFLPIHLLVSNVLHSSSLKFCVLDIDHIHVRVLGSECGKTLVTAVSVDVTVVFVL